VRFGKYTVSAAISIRTGPGTIPRPGTSISNYDRYSNSCSHSLVSSEGAFKQCIWAR